MGYLFYPLFLITTEKPYTALGGCPSCDYTYPARRHKEEIVHKDTGPEVVVCRPHPEGIRWMPSYMVAMHRLIVSDRVHNALLAEGMVRGERPGAVLEDLVMSGLSPKARTILETIGHSTPPTTSAPKTKHLKDDLETQERIRELWGTGDTSKADIAREVGYARQTVSAWIKNNLEGEAEDEGGGGDVLP